MTALTLDWAFKKGAKTVEEAWRMMMRTARDTPMPDCWRCEHCMCCHTARCPHDRRGQEQ